MTMQKPQAINGIYADLLGRAPDPAGYAHYDNLYDSLGYMGMRRDIQRQPEHQNYMLGGEPTSVGQGIARQAAAGINAMPGVFSDYTLPSMGKPQIANSALAAQGQGQDVFTNAMSMLLGAHKPADATDEAGKATPTFDNPTHQGMFDAIQGTDWESGNLRSLLGSYDQLSQLRRANPDNQALTDYFDKLPENANTKKLRAMDEAHQANLLASMLR